MKNRLFHFAILLICTGLFSCKKENVLTNSENSSIQNTKTLVPAAVNVATSGTGQRGAGGSAGGDSTGGAPNESVITSNFNGTAIPAGKTVWFNAHLKASNFNNSTPTTIYVTNETVTFSNGVTNYNVAVPKSEVTFSSGVTTASYTYDAVTDTWHINVPANYSGDVFFGGVVLPSTGLAGGINPVNFTATFTSNKPNVHIDWQWSAAVYSTFSADYNALGVLPIDANGRHSGSPMQYKNYCVGGARGGGAADLTGSWSGTGHITTL